MTWGELKRAVERLGLKDEDTLAWVDVDGLAHHDDIVVARLDNGEAEVHT